MLLVDGKFCRALAGRHLPRLITSSKPFPIINTGVLHRKMKLDLMYRSLTDWIFIWRPSWFTENFFRSSIRSMSYIYRHQGSADWRGKTGLEGQRGSAVKTRDNYPDRALVESISISSVSNQHPASISALLKPGYASRINQAIDENKGSENNILGNAGSTKEIRVGDNYLSQIHQENLLTSPVQKQHWDSIPRLLEPGYVSKITLAGKEEKRWMNHGRRISKPSHSHIHLVHSIEKRSYLLSYQAAMQLMTNGRIPALIGQKTKAGISFNSSQDYRITKPALVLSSQAAIQPMTNKRIPIMIRQRSDLDITYGTPEGIVGTAAQIAWADRITGGQHHSADIEYTAPPRPPAENNRRLESAIIREKDNLKSTAINIKRLSDQVYSIIERKLKIDRERRGIYV